MPDRIELPPLPDGTPSGVFLDTPKKRRRPIYNYRRREIPTKDIAPESISIVANEIAKKNLTTHQRKLHDYNNNGILNINALAKVIHYNHSQEVHNSIMNSHTDISYVRLYYGNDEVRVESNGSIMAMVLHCNNPLKTLSTPRGWKSTLGKDRIVLYTEWDNLISGDETLFRYKSSLKYRNPFKVLRAEVIGAEEKIYWAIIIPEGVDYWGYLRGNWETMTSVHWNNIKGVF